MFPTLYRRLSSFGFIFFVLVIVQIFSGLLNVTPHFNLPLGPELIIVGLCLIFLILISKHDHETHPSSVLNLEAVTTWLLLGYMMLNTIRALLAFKWRANPCLALWGFVPRLECIFQADINQDSSLRLWLYFVTAMGLFILSRRLSLKISKSLIPAVILFSSSLFAVISVMATFYRDKQFLPRFVILNEHSFKSMTHLMQNPSWVWPYLLPGFLCAIYFVFAHKSLPRKLFFFGLTLLIAWVMLASRQRGALVCIGVSLFLLVTGLAQRHWQQFKTWPWYVKALLVMFFCSSVLPVVSYFYFPQELVSLLNSVGLSTKLSANNVMSAPRLNIWKSAFGGMEGYWLTGHGYASWFEFFKPLAIKDGHKQIYDTAHNFFVQAIFELGLIQTLLLIGIFVWMMAKSIRHSARPAQSLYLMIICTGSYLVILSVQEVDFIRSAYYQHALFWGWLLTHHLNGSWAKEAHIASENQGRGLYVRFFEISSAVTTKLRVPLMGLGAILIVFGTGTFFWFSLAGYQFEADVTQGYNPKVRWLRSFGTLNAVHIGAQPSVYALYPVLGSTGPRITIDTETVATTWSMPKSSGASQDAEKYYLPLKIRTPFSLPDILSAPTNAHNYGRDIAVLLAWPPVYTAVPLLSGKNIYDWEALPGDDHKKIVWCQQTCTLQLLDCPKNQVRRLVVKGARPDISPVSPLITDFSFSPLASSISKGEENLGSSAEAPGTNDTLSPKLETGRLIFTDPEEPQFIDLVPESSVTLTSSSVFSSQEDQRSLGLLLWDSYCHKNP